MYMNTVYNVKDLSLKRILSILDNSEFKNYSSMILEGERYPFFTFNTEAGGMIKLFYNPDLDHSYTISLFIPGQSKCVKYFDIKQDKDSKSNYSIINGIYNYYYNIYQLSKIEKYAEFF